jgi:AbrB family looped-hinge helix DNA binding protein
MQSVITSKYQTTIPKAVRDDIGLSVKDALDWKVEKGKIIVSPSKRNFLKYRNVIKTGPGDIGNDIETARNLRVEKYRYQRLDFLRNRSESGTTAEDRSALRIRRTFEGAAPLSSERLNRIHICDGQGLPRP